MSGTAITLPGKHTATSLQLPARLSFEDWQKTGEAIQRCERAVMWWLGDWWLHGDRAYGEAAAQAIPTGYSAETLRGAAWVCEKIPAAERRDDVPYTFHMEVASLESVCRQTVLEAAAKEEWSRAELRAHLRTLRLPSNSAPPPAGLFSLIYADPPWRYEHVKTESRAIENQYPTMALEEICALSVPAADDCVLFLWTTSPKLAESMLVIERWGFVYRTSAVWDKEVIGMGYYFRQQHELLLVATRGEPGTPEESARESSVIRARRGAHSAKPLGVYELIERMYPRAKKLEMFARSSREGWTAWGNEVTDERRAAA